MELKKKFIILFVMLFVIDTIDANINFSISTSSSCFGSDIRLLRLQNDSGGYDNSHAQLSNYSISLYNNALCGNVTSSLNLNNTCGINFLRLSNQTNAHVQNTSNSDYNNVACISTNSNPICRTVLNSCPSDYRCLISISNSTNAHAGNCDKYSTKVCCKLDTINPSINLLSPSDGSNLLEGFVDYSFNVTDSSDITSCSLYLGNKVVTNTSNIIKSISNTISTNRGLGIYLWSVNCTDEFENIGSSSTRTITLTQIPGIGTGGEGSIPFIDESKINISETNLSIIYNVFKDNKFKVLNSENKNYNMTLYIQSEWQINNYSYALFIIKKDKEFFNYNNLTSNISYYIDPNNKNFATERFIQIGKGMYLIKYFTKPASKEGTYKYKLNVDLNETRFDFQVSIKVMAKKKVTFFDYVSESFLKENLPVLDYYLNKEPFKKYNNLIIIGLSSMLVILVLVIILLSIYLVFYRNKRKFLKH